MSGVVNSIEFRGTRRVRLTCSQTLASAAFTSTTYYAIVSSDNLGPNPTNVEGVLSVLNAGNQVELALDQDLAGGSLYVVTLTALPFADSSTFTGTIQGTVGLPLEAPIDVEPAASDFELLFYNRDLLHDGNDFVLTSDGDLATVAGRDNWRGAMNRRMSSYGLTWDGAYGAGVGNYVNAPQTLSLPLSGALLAQARADDRTKQASVDAIVQDTNNPGSWAFQMTIVGVDELDPLTIEVSVP